MLILGRNRGTWQLQQTPSFVAVALFLGLHTVHAFLVGGEEKRTGIFYRLYLLPNLMVHVEGGVR
jgi:hypothetical protein